MSGTGKASCRKGGALCCPPQGSMGMGDAFLPKKKGGLRGSSAEAFQNGKAAGYAVPFRTRTGGTGLSGFGASLLQGRALCRNRRGGASLPHGFRVDGRGSVPGGANAPGALRLLPSGLQRARVRAGAGSGRAPSGKRFPASWNTWARHGAVVRRALSQPPSGPRRSGKRNTFRRRKRKACGDSSPRDMTTREGRAHIIHEAVGKQGHDGTRGTSLRDRRTFAGKGRVRSAAARRTGRLCSAAECVRHAAHPAVCGTAECAAVQPERQGKSLHAILHAAPVRAFRHCPQRKTPEP